MIMASTDIEWLLWPIKISVFERAGNYFEPPTCIKITLYQYVYLQAASSTGIWKMKKYSFQWKMEEKNTKERKGGRER